jgi:sugar lactone lactonase YvrE
VRIDVVGTTRAKLGESPVWCPVTQSLFWIDIDGCQVLRFHPSTGTHEHRPLTQRPGSIFLSDDPDVLFVAAEHELLALRWSTGQTRSRLAIEATDAPTRLNDGRSDPEGRLWVGTMDEARSGQLAHGRLFRIDSDDAVSVHQEQVGVSNGLAFSPDGRTMYWADSSRETVWAFDYDRDTGTPSRQRIFLDFAELPGKPDGACVDTDGCYWIACVYGSALLRVTPKGTVNRRIELPVTKPSMPAFGGPDLRQLYVTSISSGGREPAPQSPEAGALLVLDVEAQGIPEPRVALSTNW